MSHPPPQAETEHILALGETLKRALVEQGVALHDVMAHRLGLAATDLRCLELVRRPPRGAFMTAGELAECAGLTTGAITGVLDRLERAGFVRREKSETDRRQVRVRLEAKREPELDALFAPVQSAWLALCARYSAKELALIGDFATRLQALYAEQASAARALSPSSLATASDFRELSALLSGSRAGMLSLPKGFANATLGALSGRLLYRLRYAGFEPKVTVRGGRVTIKPTRAPAAPELRRLSAALELNAQIPWTIAAGEGVLNLRADLREISLRSFEVVGGTSGLTLELPSPQGSVTVRFTGGVHGLRLLRPKGAAVRLYVAHGASGLEIDGVRHAGAGGELRWESAGYAHAENRFDVQLLGGASDLMLGVG